MFALMGAFCNKTTSGGKSYWHILDPNRLPFPAPSSSLMAFAASEGTLEAEEVGEEEDQSLQGHGWACG
jgi:hypothetical protein